MQSSLIPGLDLLNLSDKQTKNPNSCNYQADINFPLFGDNFRIPVSLSNGNCRSLEEFKKEKLISCSRIDHFYQCQDLIKKRPVTLVRYTILNPLNLDLKDQLHELEIVRNLKHHRILQYYETAVTQLTNVYFVYEPCACFLSDLMGHDKLYQLPVIKNIMLQLFEALNYMHEHAIMHRYIHPQSIAFTDSGCLKVCNFRCARWLWDQDPNIATEVSSYQSPESLMQARIFNTSVDIWSAACILAVLLLQGPFIHASFPSGILPEVFSIFGFPTKECWPDFFKIPECEFFYYNKQDIHSYNCLDLYFKRAQRPQNQSTMDLLQSMFCLDPKKRFSANQCSDHIFFAEEPKACMQDEVAHCVNIVLSSQTAQKFHIGDEMETKKEA